jgi:hypothetical protein
LDLKYAINRNVNVTIIIVRLSSRSFSEMTAVNKMHKIMIMSSLFRGLMYPINTYLLVKFRGIQINLVSVLTSTDRLVDDLVD